MFFETLFTYLFPNLNEYHNLISFIVLVILTGSLLAYFYSTKYSQKKSKSQSISVSSGDFLHRSRFRKRDKVRYFVLRYSRRLSELTKNISKQRRQRFLAQLLQNKEDDAMQLRYLPEAFLEPDSDQDEDKMSPEVKLGLLSLKMLLGKLENRRYLQLLKAIESRSFDCGEFLFKPGKPNHADMFLLIRGKVKLFHLQKNGIENVLDIVETGGTIVSLLSILDVLINNYQPVGGNGETNCNHNIYAQAVTSTQVLCLPVQVFLDLFSSCPHLLVNAVQNISMKLNRVSLFTLNKYFDLDRELICKIHPSQSISISSSFHIQRQLHFIKSKRNFLKISTSKNVVDSIDDDEEDEEEDDNANYNPHLFSSLTNKQQPKNNENYNEFNFPEIEMGAGDEDSRVLFHHKVVSNLNKPIAKFSLFPSYACDMKDVLLTAWSLLGMGLVELNSIRDAAIKDLIQFLHVEEEYYYLFNELTVSIAPSNCDLIHAGDEETNLLFIVIGEIQCYFNSQLINLSNSSKTTTATTTFSSGEIIGSLSMTSREPSLFTFRTETSSLFITMTPKFYYRLVHFQPNVSLYIASSFHYHLSHFLKQMDFALQWYSIKSGHLLYKQGDVPHSVYVIINGRLRQTHQAQDGHKELIEELGRGELIGLLETLSDQSRITNLLAVRDTEVARIPLHLLDFMKKHSSKVVTRLIELLSNRLVGNITNSQSVRQTTSSLFNSTMANVNRGPILMPTLHNIKTVAVIGTTKKVPVEAFVLELQHSMTNIGESLRVTSDIVIRRLGNAALSSGNEYSLISWLSKQEDSHEIVFYICDQDNVKSIWTKRCLRQADVILVLALASDNPDYLTPNETVLIQTKVKVNRILVLLYPDDVTQPPIGRTVQWLNSRAWIKQHFHIQCPPRLFSSVEFSHEKLISVYRRLHSREKLVSPHSDFCRLARFLTGRSIGVVLGGGGARGSAHAGILRGLYEANIPIDVIGGTSIGSFMSALWAQERNIVTFTQRARDFCREMSSVTRHGFDLTWPSVSFFTGRAFNSMVQNIFHQRHIEDLWLPYYCVSTDITNSDMRVHTQGLIWRYSRASMSYPMLVPPICDPCDNALIVDGAFVNNVPADIMIGLGVPTIFAVDVGSHNNRDFTNYGDSLSGWKIFYSKWFNSKNPIKVPSISEIQSRLAYVSCVRQLKEVRESGLCEYIRPNIDRYQTLQFSFFQEIFDVGYNCILEKIEEWRRSGKLKIYQTGLFHGDAPHRLVTSQISTDERKLFDWIDIVTRIHHSQEDITNLPPSAEQNTKNAKFTNSPSREHFSDDRALDITVSDSELLEPNSSSHKVRCNINNQQSHEANVTMLFTHRRSNSHPE